MKKRLETMVQILSRKGDSVTVTSVGEYFFVSEMQNIKAYNKIINPNTKELLGMEITLSTLEKPSNHTLDRSMRLDVLCNDGNNVILIGRHTIALNKKVLCTNNLTDEHFLILVGLIEDQMKQYEFTCIEGNSFSFDDDEDKFLVKSYVQDYRNKQYILTLSNKKGSNKQEITLPWFRRDPLTI